MHVVYICVATCVVFCSVDANAAEHHKKTIPNHNAGSKAKWTNDSSLVKIVTIDNMIDVLIAHAPELMKTFQLDPFHAPDQKESTLAFNLDLTDFKVYNLTNIIRRDEVVILHDPVNDELHVELKLKFTNLMIDSLYNVYTKAALLRLGSKGRLIANLSGMDVDVNMTIEFKNVNASLEKLILSVGTNRMKVTLSENVEAEFATVAIRLLTPFLKNIIVIILEDPIRKQINKIISSIRGNVLKSFT